MILSWVITLYTLWQMVEMHECVPGKRFDRYHELGQHALGDKLGLWIVVPQQLIVEVGVCIVYMVTGGKSLQKFYTVAFPNGTPIRTSYWIMIFGGIHLFLSQLPNFNSITLVSLAAAVMSLRYVVIYIHLYYYSTCLFVISYRSINYRSTMHPFSYSTIAWVASVHKGRHADVDYSKTASTATGQTFNFLSALGDVAFAYAGHNVVLEIQATIPSTPEKPSKKPMWLGVLVAYFVVAICYLPVAFVGYYVFGNAVDDNILITLEKPRWLIAAANLFVVVHVIGSYQIYAMPVFDMLETFLVKQLRFTPGLPLRLIARTLYVGESNACSHRVINSSLYTYVMHSCTSLR
jgi:amino acid permease